MRFVEAHNGMSAKIVDQSNYDGIWVSSLTHSLSKGLPDTELIPLRERALLVAEIKNITDKPILVDVDTGGQTQHAYQNMKALKNAGAWGIVMEDKCFPKKNSLIEGAQHILEEPDKFSEKIAEVRKVSDLIIFARLESLIAEQSMEDALMRAEAYLQAGANGIVIHSKMKMSADEVVEFAQKFRDKHPEEKLVCIPTTYNNVTDQELYAFFDIIIHANHLFRASFTAMQRTINQMYDDDRTLEVSDDMVDVKTLIDLV